MKYRLHLRTSGYFALFLMLLIFGFLDWISISAAFWIATGTSFSLGEIGTLIGFLVLTLVSSIFIFTFYRGFCAPMWIDVSKRILAIPYWSKIDATAEIFLGSLALPHIVGTYHEQYETLLRTVFPLFMHRRKIPFNQIRSVLILPAEAADTKKDYVGIYSENSPAREKFVAYAATPVDYGQEGDVIAVEMGRELIIRHTLNLPKKSDIAALGEHLRQSGVNVVMPNHQDEKKL